MLSRVDPARDLVLVVAPAAPDDAAELTAFAVAGPGIDPGRARSATTRRDGYVTLPDVGVTVLDALGVSVPDAMNGTEITSGGGPAYGPTTAHELADANTIAVFRDRTVGPVSVIFVTLQIVTYLVAMVLLVRGRRRRWGRAAVLFAGLVIVALPVVTFLLGLVRYDRLGLAGYTARRRGGGGRAGARWRCPPGGWHWARPRSCAWSPSTGWCRSSTSSPAVTSRSTPRSGTRPSWPAASRASATWPSPSSSAPPSWWPPAEWEPGGRARPRPDRWWALVAAIFAVTVVVDGWPAFGSDVGGVLACVPAFALVLIWLGGWRVSVRRVIAIGAATVAVLAVFALVDLARPATERTHLGRFVADVFDGEAGVVVRRKLEANWQVLTSSVFALLVPALVVGFAVLVTRRRGLVADGPGPVAGAAALPARRRGRRGPRVRRERLRGGDPRDDDRHGGALAHPPPVRVGARAVTADAGP